MADGKGCTCGAYGESECGCDADWTPQELIDARAEIARLRLTDAEREAVDEAAGFYAGVIEDARCQQIAGTLRKMLERLGGER